MSPATNHRSSSSGRKRLVRSVPSTPQSRPRVTAVILAYNYGRYLGACVQSVLGQPGVDAKAIVVDDCSTDETPKVCAELAHDPRVTVIRHEVNLGQIPSMNRAFELVDSEYTVKLDADDLVAPGAWARATALLQAHPEVGFVYGRPMHFSGREPVLAARPSRNWTLWPGHDWFERRCRSGANAISQPEVLVRTATLRKVGPVRVDLPHTFDMHQWLRLASIADVGRVNGPAQGLYRVHATSLSRTLHAGVLFDLRGRRDAFDLAAKASTFADAGELQAAARLRLSAIALEWATRAYDRGRTDELAVEDLVAFALETSPGARKLPEWSAWQRRSSAGPAGARKSLRFRVAGARRRASWEMRHRRWLATGEY
jgi:Glycosyl transferase family 2